ncbi:CPBP family intramembrane glutamic endopeptidase [Streptomyces sp. NPDC059786]|uniref:CPBP family intramembrane glutamic endopeptidase n=1 Tax=Streptomyces sp. NPDC059786 TaxID=3346946 RepID=UPI00365BF60A
MTIPPAPAPLTYHRLARLSLSHRWWRPVTGTLFVAVGWVLLLGLLDLSLSGLGALKGYPEGPDGWVEFGPVTGTAVDLLLIATAIPVVLLAVRWIGRRPAGTASSVTGRLRWRLLGSCVLLALPVLAVSACVLLLVPGVSEPPSRWAGFDVLLPALAMLVVLVPLQAAAEEYVFRGWLLQAAGAFFRSPWIAVLPQAVLFAAAHGWGTAWGFADLTVYGVLAGWLTVRTGGLEAAIGLHAVNNLLAFGLSAAVVDGLKSDETAADATWQIVAVDLAGAAVYALAVLWLVRRRPLARAAAAPVPAPPDAPWPPVPFPGATVGFPNAATGFPGFAAGREPAGYLAAPAAPVPYAPSAPHPYAPGGQADGPGPLEENGHGG